MRSSKRDSILWLVKIRGTRRECGEGSPAREMAKMFWKENKKMKQKAATQKKHISFSISRVVFVPVRKITKIRRKGEAQQKYFPSASFEGDNSAFHTTVENLVYCECVWHKKRGKEKICRQHQRDDGSSTRPYFLFNFISILEFFFSFFSLPIFPVPLLSPVDCDTWLCETWRERERESSERSRLPYFVSLYFIFVSRDSLSSTTLFILLRLRLHLLQQIIRGRGSPRRRCTRQVSLFSVDSFQDFFITRHNPD